MLLIKSKCRARETVSFTTYFISYRQLNSSIDKLNNDSLDHFLSALTLFRHPSYRRMMDHLRRAEDILPLLAKLNLTDLMLKVIKIFSRLR